MIKQEAKYVTDSLVEQVHIVMPEHTNSFGRLFGGQLLAWIDVAAAVVARRHCRCYVNTVHISDVSFKAPADVADMIVLCGRITYIGSTSLEVRVDTYAEDISGQRQLINEAYIVMVSIGEDGRPTSAPGLICETEQQKADWEAGEKRYLRRKAESKRG